MPVVLQEDKAQIKVYLKVERQPLNRTLTETEIMAFLKSYPTATQEEVAAAVSKSVNTVKNATVHLQELGLLKRDGA